MMMIKNQPLNLLFGASLLLTERNLAVFPIDTLLQRKGTVATLHLAIHPEKGTILPQDANLRVTDLQKGTILPGKDAIPLLVKGTILLVGALIMTGTTTSISLLIGSTKILRTIIDVLLEVPLNRAITIIDVLEVPLNRTIAIIDVLEVPLIRTITSLLEVPLNRTITSLLEVPLNRTIIGLLVEFPRDRTIISLLVDVFPMSLLRGFSSTVLEVPLNRTIISLLVDVFPTSLLRGFSSTMSEFKGYFELFFVLFWVLIHSYVIVFIIYCTFQEA